MILAIYIIGALLPVNHNGLRDRGLDSLRNYPYRFPLLAHLASHYASHLPLATHEIETWLSALALSPWVNSC